MSVIFLMITHDNCDDNDEDEDDMYDAALINLITNVTSFKLDGIHATTVA